MNPFAILYRVAKPELVGCRHAVDKEPGLVATSKSIDNTSIVSKRGLSGERVPGRTIVEASIDPAKFASGDDSLECFIYHIAVRELREILRNPDIAWTPVIDSLGDLLASTSHDCD